MISVEVLFCDFLAGCLLRLLRLGVWFRDCLLVWCWLLGLLAILFGTYCAVAVV